MKRLLIAFAAAGAMLLAAVASTALAADSKDVYYVSLGDSLAAGEQPIGNLTQGSPISCSNWSAGTSPGSVSPSSAAAARRPSRTHRTSTRRAPATASSRRHSRTC